VVLGCLRTDTRKCRCMHAGVCVHALACFVHICVIHVFTCRRGYHIFDTINTCVHVLQIRTSTHKKTRESHNCHAGILTGFLSTGAHCTCIRAHKHTCELTRAHKYEHMSTHTYKLQTETHLHTHAHTDAQTSHIRTLRNKHKYVYAHTRAHYRSHHSTARAHT
jgi:hypothetical protein